MLLTGAVFLCPCVVYYTVTFASVVTFYYSGSYGGLADRDKAQVNFKLAIDQNVQPFALFKQYSNINAFCTFWINFIT